jgi:uncharacterized membrane protein YfcA
MTLWDLIPSDVGLRTALAICAIGFIAGTARGFSGFGAALIFMPLASSLAAPRLVAALLLVIDFVAAAPLVPNAWRHADRKATAIMVLGALIGVPVGTWLLTRLDPVTTRWIISGFVIALLMLLLSGWRYRGASDFFSLVSYAVTGLITLESIRFSLLVGPVYGLGVGFGASLFGRASDKLFRTICYAMIALAVIIGLPLLDGTLR